MFPFQQRCLFLLLLSLAPTSRLSRLPSIKNQRNKLRRKIKVICSILRHHLDLIHSVFLLKITLGATWSNNNLLPRDKSFFSFFIFLHSESWMRENVPLNNVDGILSILTWSWSRRKFYAKFLRKCQKRNFSNDVNMMAVGANESDSDSLRVGKLMCDVVELYVKVLHSSTLKKA